MTHALCRATWEDPVNGYSVDTYEVSEDGQTLIQTTVYVRESNGRQETFKTVWKKRS
jgi:hypothetical protein